MKFLPYYIDSSPGNVTIHLLFLAIPDSWLDIAQLAAVLAPNKDAFLAPLDLSLEVTETEGFPGLGVCGVAVAFESVPRTLPQGLQLTIWPVGERLNPYFTLPYDYILLSFTAVNAVANNPFDLDNFFASRFEVVYAVSDISAMTLPQEHLGYEEPQAFGNEGFLSAVSDENHRYYGDQSLEKAYRYNEEYRQESVINLRGVNPFTGTLPSGHMLVKGCHLHLTNEPYFDTISGVPTDAYSLNDVPNAATCYALGLTRIYRTGFQGLEFSLFSYLENNGIEPKNFIGGTSRPPIIFLPPPWHKLSQPGATILTAWTFLHNFKLYSSLLLTIHGEPVLIGGEGITF